MSEWWLWNVLVPMHEAECIERHEQQQENAWQQKLSAFAATRERDWRGRFLHVRQAESEG